jgi:vacuolar-type H+-ATPase subunit E/Vma4
MDNKVLGQLNRENAKVICDKISLDADKEAEAILVEARKESEKIISAARQFVEQKKEAILRELELELVKSKERILSSLTLEKKRLALAQKDKFVQSVLDEVRKKPQKFRQEPGYPEFLEKAVVEGVKVIGENNIEIYYSDLDEQLFKEGFIKKIKSACSLRVNRDCNIKFTRSDFKDLGVIVNSEGGRTIYDNRFLARLERGQEEIYMALLKESF